ncbi:MAG: hypothetical protein FJ313_05020, partial [Gemmatimonadetes bacterium]|nr:hypothetical protein [Gemmatimonadota bacterium]
MANRAPTYNPAMNLVLLWGIRLGILLLLFTPLIHWRDTVFPWVVPKAIWSRSLIEAVFAMWVVLAIRRPEYRPRRSWLVLIFALLVLAALIAAFFGVSFQRSFWSNFERMQGVFDLLHWGVLLFVLIWTVRGVRQWRLILNGMVAMGFAVGLLGIAQRLGGSVPLFRLMGPQERLDITLGNPTYVGGYMVTVCMIALGLLADSLTSGATATWLERRGGRSRARGVGRPWNAGNAWPLRVYRAATAVLAVWVIGETGSRGALAALVGGIFFAGLLYAVWGRGARLRAAAAAVAAAIVVVVPLSLFARQSPALQALGGITPVFERTFGEAGEGAAAERSVGARMAL